MGALWAENKIGLFVVRTLEVSGYRFHSQRQRHVLEDTPEASGHEKEDTREAELAKKLN